MNKSAVVEWFDDDNPESYLLCCEEYGIKFIFAKVIDKINVIEKHRHSDHHLMCSKRFCADPSHEDSHERERPTLYSSLKCRGPSKVVEMLEIALNSIF